MLVGYLISVFCFPFISLLSYNMFFAVLGHQVFIMSLQYTSVVLNGEQSLQQEPWWAACLQEMNNKMGESMEKGR